MSGAQLAAINGKPLYSALDWSGNTGDTFNNFRRSTETYTILDLPYYIVSAAPSSGTTISPATRSIVASGATAQTIAVASSTSWTATTSVSWLTITGGASGSGNGTVTYNVAANTAAQRVGVITVAGQAHTVTQAATTPPVAAPANNAFANRISLAGASVTTNGSNVGATKEAGEPTHASSTSSKSVWWTWTAPASGSVTIDTIGSSFDTLLAVYAGSSISALTSVAANDDGVVDGTSRVTFGTTAGIAYQIAVDGYAGASGNITLRLLLTSIITTEPASQTAITGASVTMTVAATGTAPLRYQWRKDVVNLAGATSASLTLTNVQASQAGSYTVLVTTGAGSATSSAAILTVGSA
ncbi:MAG: immunoglobulin domain-containing protein, partial [Verrucomicrobia bacterium]|nr:immunoglobulin domain-containing protein [Verrucomicrobiota bacterium]